MENKAMKIKINTIVEIDDDTIIGVLDSAFAYCGWWDQAKLGKQGTVTTEAWAGHVMSGGFVVVTTDDKYGDKGTLVDRTKGQFHYKLDRAAVERGLQELANDAEYKHHFADIINENDDAITGDVLLQFALFGTSVFG